MPASSGARWAGAAASESGCRAARRNSAIPVSTRHDQQRGERQGVAVGDPLQVGSARDAAAIWAALHGFATLRSLRPQFPWPDADTMLDRIVYGLAQIRDA
jgi:hypothetical protein